VRREYETKDGATAFKYERILSSLIGYIEEVQFYDSEFGKQLYITLDKNEKGQKPIIQLNMEGREADKACLSSASVRSFLIWTIDTAPFKIFLTASVDLMPEIRRHRTHRPCLVIESGHSEAGLPEVLEIEEIEELEEFERVTALRV